MHLQPGRVISLLAAPIVVIAAVVGCGADREPSVPDAAADGEQPFPDVVAVELSPGSGGGHRIAVTISSPYDTPERYADAWRVLAPDGSVLGERVLAHDHAAEQPFTRSLDGLGIPDDVDEITVEGRDLVNGWGGATMTVPVP